MTLSVDKPDDTTLLLKVAALQAWFGQDKGLAETCRRGLAAAKNTTNSQAADRLAKGCCVLPSTDKAQLGAALELAGKAVQLGKNSTRYWFQLALGMAEYRSGRFAEADAVLTAAAKGGEKSPRRPRPPDDGRAPGPVRRGLRRDHRGRQQGLAGQADRLAAPG